MNALIRTTMIALLIITGVTLLPSCAKKTTGPSESLITFEEFLTLGEDCVWVVYSQHSVYSPEINNSWGVIQQTSEPRTDIPEVSLVVNGMQSTNLAQWSYDNYDGKHRYYITFRYSGAEFTEGQVCQFELTVDEVTTSTSFTIPYTATITQAPEAFIYDQPTTFRWSLSKSAGYQWIYYDYSIKDDYDYNYELISPSARAFTIPANTVPPEWLGVSFQISTTNIKIINNTAFMYDTYAYYDYGDGYYAPKEAKSGRRWLP